MKRQIINRIILILFVAALFLMGSMYVRQEHKMAELEQEHQELLAKQEKIKYLINEYNVLLETVDSRNYIVRIAREKFGWVFDDELVYKIPTANPPSAATPTLPPITTAAPTPTASPEVTE